MTILVKRQFFLVSFNKLTEIKNKNRYLYKKKRLKLKNFFLCVKSDRGLEIFKGKFSGKIK